MKKSRILLFLILIVFSTLTTTEAEEKILTRRKRIINGQMAKSRDFPYMVSIQGKSQSKMSDFLFGKKGKSYCGGTIIDAKWILTAAHCFDTDKGKRPLKPKYWHIRMADEKLKPSTSEKYKGYLNYAQNKLFGSNKEQNYYHTSKIFIHPEYKEGILENDIALMKIEENIDLTKLEDASSILLPDFMNARGWPPENQMCVVSGWGCGKAGGSVQHHVRKADLPIISGNTCREMYGTKSYINLTDSKEFCAGYSNRGVSICPGDSGGPIACPYNGKMILAGVVSAAHKSQPENYPGLFTRVSYYMPWIKAIIVNN